MSIQKLFKGKTAKEVMVWGLKDMFTGWSKWEALYAFILLSLQVGVLFVPVPGSELTPLWLKVVSFIVGVSGTICVLLVAKGKMTNYLFGTVQTFFGVVVGGYHGLIGETLENAMYLVFQFIGAKEWAENLKDDSAVETKRFHLSDWFLTVGSIAVLTFGVGTIFNFFNGNFGYTDAFTLIVAIIAQLLMVYRYREQWVIWFALNVVSVWQFYHAGDSSMFALYVALTINTVYGWAIWTRTAEKSEKTKPIYVTLKGSAKGLAPAMKKRLKKGSVKG